MLKPITPGLQFRLTLGYVLISTLLLASAGVTFRSSLTSTVNNHIREDIDHDWAAMNGLLNIRDGRTEWLYDRDDREATYRVARLQRVFLLTDAKGSVLQESDLYAALDTTPDEVRNVLSSLEPASRKVLTDAQGRSYLVRSGVVYSNDQSHAPYFAAIGRSLADSQKVIRQFTEVYAGLMATVVFSGCLLCWFIRQRDDAAPRQEDLRLG